MPKIVDQEAYRRQLATAATRLFGERGYGSLSMRALARGLGVSSGTLYHYFPSKQRLFQAAVRVVFEGHVEAVRATSRSLQGERLAARGEGSRTLASDEDSGASRHADLRHGLLELRELYAFFLAHEREIMRDFLVLTDFWRLHPEERASLEPLLREAHDTYAEVVASLLGVPSHGLGELMISALFNLLEQRWFHGPEFDCEPQLELLERLVALERARLSES